jgi:hypothetical protein
LSALGLGGGGDVDAAHAEDAPMPHPRRRTPERGRHRTKSGGGMNGSGHGGPRSGCGERPRTAPALGAAREEEGAGRGGRACPALAAAAGPEQRERRRELGEVGVLALCLWPPLDGARAGASLCQWCAGGRAPRRAAAESEPARVRATGKPCRGPAMPPPPGRARWRPALAIERERGRDDGRRGGHTTREREGVCVV